MIALPPTVEISEIASRKDRFRCLPYAAVIMADTCVRRQAMVRAGIRADEMSKCKACVFGRQVEANSGGAMEVLATTANAQNGLQKLNKRAFADSPVVAYGKRPRGPKCVNPKCTTVVWAARVKAPVPGTEGMCGACRTQWVNAVKRAKPGAKLAPPRITLRSHHQAISP